MFKELDRVRVVRLLTPDRPFDGTERVRRAPQVGDVGTIVWAPELEAGRYYVEYTEGIYTVWHAWFEAEELEPE